MVVADTYTSTPGFPPNSTEVSRVDLVADTLKRMIMEDGVRLTQGLFGVHADLSGKYQCDRVSQCLIGRYLVGKEVVSGNGRGAFSSIYDAGYYLRISEHCVDDLMFGFDTYPWRCYSGGAWVDLGWDLARFADSLGVLEIPRCVKGFDTTQPKGFDPAQPKGLDAAQPK